MILYMYKKYYIFRKGRCGGRIFMVLKKNTKKHLWSLYHQMLIVLFIFVILLSIWLRALRSIKKGNVSFHFICLCANIC